MEKITLTPENTLGYQLDKETFNNILSAKQTTFEVELRDDSYPDHLEHVDGCLVLNVEELPTAHYGVYFYNNGVFPYAFNEKLKYLMFIYGKKRMAVELKKREAQPGVRFRFQENAPSVHDENGDCTIWSIVYTIELLK